jgi:carbamoyltransferase
MKTLGIHWGHDSAFCLMEDGKILAHIEVERISRIKKHPIKTLKDFDKYINIFLEKTNTRWTEVDAVLLCKIHNQDNYPRFILDSIPKDIEIIFYDHHDSHAAIGYYLSPYDESLILTVDGGGNDCGLAMYYGEGKEISTLKKVGDGAIGQVWTATKRYFSKTKNGPMGTEGVLMGASPYGEVDQALVDWFYENMTTGSEMYVNFPKQLKSKFTGGLFKKPYLDPNSEKDYFNVCRSIQTATERLFCDLFEEIKSFGHNTDNIILSGGVMLNCVALGKIVKKYFDNVYTPFSVDDAGLAIGNCLLHWHQTLGHERIPLKFNHTPYLGFEYQKEDIDSVINSSEDIIIEEADINEVARLISEGNIISLYQGRSESGKRALGNRSIIADPRSSDMKRVINEKVKMRHWYRPFAPAVLKEMSHEIFDTELDSPYMSYAVPVKQEWKDKLGAVTHIDGSARFQTVERDFNQLYYDLINAFYIKTGVPVLLNTSFNESEPIVDSPKHALECFMRTNIDYLFMDGKLISKK